MVGHPKYKGGDLVLFQVENNVYSGEIVKVDPWGIFGDNSDVFYDIFYYDAEVFHNIAIYKHIPEYDVIKSLNEK
ncbi:MAG: hypothetical protein H9W80_12360 [Enterococcus sp.]|nr:hypothetical protein [Enterococcus sp.]